MRTYGKNWTRRLDDEFSDPPSRAEKKCFRRMLRGVRRNAVLSSGSVDSEKRDPSCNEVLFEGIGYYSKLVRIPRSIRSVVLDWYYADCAERASIIGVGYMRPRQLWRLEDR